MLSSLSKSPVRVLCCSFFFHWVGLVLLFFRNHYTPRDNVLGVPALVFFACFCWYWYLHIIHDCMSVLPHLYGVEPW